MKDREHIHMSGYQGRIILFAIMIGFCVLALIAIVRGQREIRGEREQTSLAEESNEITQVQEEVRDDTQNADKTESDMTVPIEEDMETDTNTESQQTADNTEEDASQDMREDDQGSGNTQNSRVMQIVLLGDSILEGTAEFDNIDVLLIGECNANVYNMAMGGTTAALVGSEQFSFEHWDSRGLLGVVNAIVGNISGDILEGYHAGEVLKGCNFTETDYFVIDYGLNDFFARVPESRYLADGGVREEDEPHTYAGALDLAVSTLLNAFPNAKIMLIPPHYCQFFGKEGYLGDSYTLDYGYGPLLTYTNVCKNVYEKHVEDNVMYFDAFYNSGIKVETADWYLEDGIHLNAAGRHKYAECISERILKDFYPVE